MNYEEKYKKLKKHCRALLKCSRGYYNSIDIERNYIDRVDGHEWMEELAKMIDYKDYHD